MFKKPFTTKPTTPVRSSERKALIAQIAEDYGVDADLAKSLVPEGLLNGKAATHLDEPCIIFSDPQTGDPLFVRRGKGADGLFFPTIYTLLKARTLLPILATPSFVVDKLRDGADLFQGGLSPASLASLPELKEGALVAVASIDNPTVPRAVGQLARDSRSLSQSGDGKAVLTLHAFGDFLWNAGSKQEPNELASHASKPKRSEEQADKQETPAAASDDLPPYAEPPAKEAAALSSKDVDAILRTALLLAIKKTLPKDAKAYPLPASSIWSGHVLPCRPASSPVDIKQSSYKKLTAFLKAASKDGLLTLKETKSDVLVLSIKADHPDVVAQKSYKTVADAAKQDAAHNGESTAAAPSSAKSIKVKELYAPHGASLSFWSEMNKSGDDLLTATEVRSSLNAYITEHQLAFKADAKYFKPDEALERVLPDRGDADAGAVPRHDAVEALLQGMQRWHLLEIGDEKPQKKKGAGPRIEISVKQRMGSRVVTIIVGLEAFQLNPEEIAAALQILCASSSGCNELPKSTPKKPLYEATVQGDQTSKVVTYLVEQHGVPKSSIDTIPLKRK